MSTLPVPSGDRGCAVIADTHGRILEFVVDELGLAQREAPATWIVDLVASPDRDAVSTLIEAARVHDPTFDRLIAARVDGTVATLHFAALRRADVVLVAAAENRIALVRVHDALLDHVGATADDPARASLRGRRDAARDDDRADALAVDVVRIEDRLADHKRELARTRETLERCEADAPARPAGTPGATGGDDGH